MISYRDTHKTRGVNDGFATIFREACDFFAKSNVQVVGQGYAEVVTNDNLFESYVDKITGMMDANQKEQFVQLAESSRLEMLRESMGGITPIASLQLPLLRRFWPRLAMNEVIPVEPVAKPKLAIGVTVPYLIDTQGNRHKLPKAIVGSESEIAFQGRAKLKTDPINVPCSGQDLLTAAGGATKAGDYIDVDFYVTSAKVDISAAKDGSQLVDIVLNAKLDAKTSSITTSVKSKVTSVLTEHDTLFAVLNRQTGKLTATSVAGRVKSVVVEGYLSSEYNNRVEQVTFDIEQRDIDIGSGTPIAASITANTAQDTAAMYNLDSHMLLTDLASSTLAQRHDVEALSLLSKLHSQNAYSDEYSQYVNEFDMHSPAQFAGQPTAWREELKRVIDFQFNKMKTDLYVQRGESRIVGNPLDTAVIHNINWVFNGHSEEMAGVDVDYSIATYSTGNGPTKIVATQNARAGSLRTLFVPSQDTQISVKYMPYAYNVFTSQDGYRNPGAPNVPSILMNRRDTFFTELPMVGQIDILNNDGTLAN